MDDPPATMDDPPTSVNDLPNEILLQIFSYLSLEDIGLNVQFVCTRWFEVCSFDVLWRNNFLILEENGADDYIASMFEKVPKLQCLWIGFSPSPEVLYGLAEYCKDLRKLVLYEPQFEYSHDAFKSLVFGCTKLEELTIPGGALAEKELAELVGQWRNLNAIFLIGESDKPVMLKPLADGCPSLQHLLMRDLKSTYWELKYFLQKKRNKLKTLSISPNTYEGLCAIPLLTLCKARLSKLQVEDTRYSCIDYCNSRGINTLKRVRYLSMRISHGLRNSMVSNIFEDKAMSQLVELELSNCTKLNDTLVHVISNNCPNLFSLSLRYSTHLNDDDLKYLYKCTHLKELDLYYCTELTDTGVDHVLKCSDLIFLNLGFCKITKKSLVRLTVLTELTGLVLDGCDVAGLPMWLFPQHLRKLRNLKLDYCVNIDAEVVAALQAKMPYLKVSTKQVERSP